MKNEILKLEQHEHALWDKVSGDCCMILGQNLPRILQECGPAETHGIMNMISVMSAGMADRMIRLRRERTDSIIHSLDS
jgi:hypothetical protein